MEISNLTHSGVRTGIKMLKPNSFKQIFNIDWKWKLKYQSKVQTAQKWEVKIYLHITLHIRKKTGRLDANK